MLEQDLGVRKIATKWKRFLLWEMIFFCSPARPPARELLRSALVRFLFDRS